MLKEPATSRELDHECHEKPTLLPNPTLTLTPNLMVECSNS